MCQLRVRAHRHPEAVLAQDDACVLIRDMYPKARRHALVLPRAAGLDSAAELTRAHLPLLARMQVGFTSLFAGPGIMVPSKHGACARAAARRRPGLRGGAHARPPAAAGAHAGRLKLPC